MIARSYKDSADFEQVLKSHEREYNATRKDAIQTVVRWAITDEKDKGIDQKIWDENNRLTGADV